MPAEQPGEYQKFTRDSWTFYFHKSVPVDEIEFYEWIKFADFVINRSDEKVIKARIPLVSIFDQALGV